MNKKNNWFRKYRLYVYAGVVLGLWFYIYTVFRIYGTEHYAKTASDMSSIPPNNFGDSFGYINAWFSALAFAGVVCALLIQTAEFHLAEEERADGLQAQKEIADQTQFAAKAQMIDSLIGIYERKEIAKPRLSDSEDIDNYARRLAIATQEYKLAFELQNMLNIVSTKGSDSTKHFAIAERLLEIDKHLSSICNVITSAIKEFEEPQSGIRDNSPVNKLGYAIGSLEGFLNRDAVLPPEIAVEIDNRMESYRDAAELVLDSGSSSRRTNGLDRSYSAQAYGENIRFRISVLSMLAETIDLNVSRK